MKVKKQLLFSGFLIAICFITFSTDLLAQVLEDQDCRDDTGGGNSTCTETINCGDGSISCTGTSSCSKGGCYVCCDGFYTWC